MESPYNILTSKPQTVQNNLVNQYTDFITSVLSPINDSDPPVISATNADTSSTIATITWTTDEPATSLVDYGTDNNYGTSVSDSNYVTSHSIELTGLSSSTDYHFMATSEDASNNSASSVDTHFTTTSPPALVSIAISPDGPSITEGSTQQFTVTGTYSDETNKVLAADTWESSDSTVATIDTYGLATGTVAGSTTIKAIYAGKVDTTALTVTTAPVEPASTSVSSIDYLIYGGRDNSKHLDITVTIIDNFSAPVSGASVSIDLLRDGGQITLGNGITATDGTVTFSLKNAASGHYETDVTSVSAGGLIFVDNYDDLGFDK